MSANDTPGFITLIDIVDINNSGQIAGTGFYRTGMYSPNPTFITQAFVANVTITPPATSAPEYRNTLALLIIPLAAFVVFRRPLSRSTLGARRRG